MKRRTRIVNWVFLLKIRLLRFQFLSISSIDDSVRHAHIGTIDKLAAVAMFFIKFFSNFGSGHFLQARSLHDEC